MTVGVPWAATRLRPQNDTCIWPLPGLLAPHVLRQPSAFDILVTTYNRVNSQGLKDAQAHIPLRPLPRLLASQVLGKPSAFDVASTWSTPSALATPTPTFPLSSAPTCLPPGPGRALRVRCRRDDIRHGQLTALWRRSQAHDHLALPHPGAWDGGQDPVPNLTFRWTTATENQGGLLQQGCGLLEPSPGTAPGTTRPSLPPS